MKMLSPEQVAVARQMRADGAKLRDIGAKLGVGKDTVRRACEGIVCPVDHRAISAATTLQTKNNLARLRSMSFADEARAMRLDGMSWREIADYFVVDAFTVRKWARAVRSRPTEVSPALLKMSVPAWVPDWLRLEYAQQTRLYGEEKAASVCRHLKREASRQCA